MSNEDEAKNDYWMEPPKVFLNAPKTFEEAKARLVAVKVELAELKRDIEAKHGKRPDKATSIIVQEIPKTEDREENNRVQKAAFKKLEDSVEYRGLLAEARKPGINVQVRLIRPYQSGTIELNIRFEEEADFEDDD